MALRRFLKFLGKNKASDGAPAAVVTVPRLNVIPREAHGISRKNISPNALRVLYRLKDAGYGAYLVGGAVRDLLLGEHPKDFDVATSATPEQVRQLFRNCRLIGRRFRLAHVVFGPEIIEVATFRASGDDGSGDRQMQDGRIVRDNVYGSIEDDAIRRDFTVNALYYAVEDFSVRDYTGGYEDVQQRVLRLIGDPETRFREDPVRMLRAIRLAAKLDFSIEPKAYAAINKLAPLIAEAAPARLFDELLKLFLSGHAVDSFKGLLDSGLLQEMLPLTARALSTHAKGSGAALIDTALSSTDQRLAAGKSVTPSFLLAALLWPAARHAYNRGIADGLDAQAAWIRAADKVVGEQVKRIAMPKRFTVPMQEIWLMQPRFENTAKKRIGRLLAHPRFRAAYDFFVLRALDEPELEAQLAWWKDTLAREKPAPVRGGHDDGVEPTDDAGDDAGEPAATGAPKKRRRRRRRSGGAGGGGGGGEG